MRTFKSEVNSLHFLLLTTTESLKICQYNIIFDMREPGLDLPTQLIPFPVYPILHMHVKLPAEL